MSVITRPILSGLGILAAAAIAAGCGIALEPSPAHAPSAFPPCQTEDSSGPCHWNAQTQGNGKGRSFTVLGDGSVVYDPSPEWKAARQSERDIASEIYNAAVEGCDQDLHASYVGLTHADAWPDGKDGQRVAVIPGHDGINLAIRPYEGGCK